MVLNGLYCNLCQSWAWAPQTEINFRNRKFHNLIFENVTQTQIRKFTIGLDDLLPQFANDFNFRSKCWCDLKIIQPA